MSAKIARYKDAKWLAYDAANGENEFFLTFEDAEAWLGDCNDEGIAEEVELGLSYIARITHHTATEITDRKENYHEHSDACPKDCDEEEWPYDSDYDHVSRVYMAPIDTAESAKTVEYRWSFDRYRPKVGKMAEGARCYAPTEEAARAKVASWYTDPEDEGTTFVLVDMAPKGDGAEEEK